MMPRDASPAAPAAPRTDPLLFTAVALMLFASVFDFARLGFSEELAGLGNSLAKMAAAAFAGGVAFVRRAAIDGPALRRGAPLWAYVAVATASLAWSVAPGETAVGLAGLLVFTALASVSALADLDEMVKVVRRVCDLVVVASLAWWLFEPVLASAYLQGADRLAGITFGPHALARCAAVSLLARTHELKTRFNVFQLAYASGWLALHVATIALADSRQTYFAALAGLVVLLAPRSGRATLAYGAGVLFLAAGAWTVAAIGGHDAIGALMARLARESSEDVTNLTGRTAIWATSLDLIGRRPFLGYGFNAGGVALSETYATDFGWTTGSAHNALLHSLLDLGLAGALLVLASAGMAAWRAARGARVGLAMIALIVVLGVIERSIAGAAGFLYFLFALFLVRDPAPESGALGAGARVTLLRPVPPMAAPAAPRRSHGSPMPTRYHR